MGATTLPACMVTRKPIREDSRAADLVSVDI
jgi:hypothetical protein